MTIHQFVPVLLPHDAVGNCARELQHRLHFTDSNSRIYVEDRKRSDPMHATPVEEMNLGPQDVLIYHYANFSALAPSMLAQGRTLLYYHNITPERYFTAWDPDTAIAQRRARQQLARLVHQAMGCLSVSAFNAEELVSYGANDVATVGLFAHYDDLKNGETTGRLTRLQRSWEHRGSPTDWLFVGRLVPNKAQEDLLASFALYRELTGEDSSLTLVGRPFHPDYLLGLRQRAIDLRIGHRVHFLTGGLRARYLGDQYRVARIFVSASLHEGFGAPLLEAMSLGLPVVAVGSSAIPETVGDAGFIVPPHDPLATATAAKLASQEPLRSQLLDRGAERIKLFDNNAVWGRMVEAIRRLTDTEVV
ncbi:glycosyltransferase [Ferrimicrobium sp.]|uniref:glycosyltransferase n=1 Tax=Ferrimicrobium sp. TaxID=2926050 RepID=UPI002612D997|nr:glycosyltransferase [Ferrimicrobium sp.]